MLSFQTLRLEGLEREQGRLEKRQTNLQLMRADDEISKEDFARLSAETKGELNLLDQEAADLSKLLTDDIHIQIGAEAAARNFYEYLEEAAAEGDHEIYTFESWMRMFERNGIEVRITGENEWYIGFYGGEDLYQIGYDNRAIQAAGYNPIRHGHSN